MGLHYWWGIYHTYNHLALVVIDLLVAKEKNSFNVLGFVRVMQYPFKAL
jgi:hypothetical protein